MMNSINMLATIYSSTTAILYLLEKNMHKNLGYPEIFIFWVELDIHHYSTILMPVHWTITLKWIGL